MSQGRALDDPSTPALQPPMGGNEVDEHQPVTARRQGDAYGAALQEMAREDGAALARAGNYLVALITEKAEGMYAPSDSTGLVWREAAERANAHIEVAVADSADGRFVPGLDVTVGLFDGEKRLLSSTAPFLWHPFLYHYGFNARVPGTGPFTVLVTIDRPTWMRHDPVNGKRYESLVEVAFDGVCFDPGREPSPGAEPRGLATPYAG